MKTIYNLYEASLLDEIDNTLELGYKTAEKMAVADWLKDNIEFLRFDGYASVHFDNKVDIDKLIFNSKNELSLDRFDPLNHYGEKKYMKLPIPDFVKLDKVDNMSFCGHKNDFNNIGNFKDLPHINKLTEMFLRCWDIDGWKPKLADIKSIDEISIIEIDFEGVKNIGWPKSKIGCVELFIDVCNLYSEDQRITSGKVYDINNLKSLSCNELIIPDFFITNSNSRFRFFSRDIIINKDRNTEEWNKLNEIYNTKSFKKLFIYCANLSSHNRKFHNVKKSGDDFIITSRNSNVKNKYRK
jgi:hypothetical protein